MADLDDAFEVDSLLVGENELAGAIIYGNFDPSVIGQDAPLGSFFMRDNGDHYRKTGAGTMAWKLIEGPQFLQFCERDGTVNNIPIIGAPNYFLPFFNRSGAADNIGII